MPRTQCWRIIIKGKHCSKSLKQSPVLGRKFLIFGEQWLYVAIGQYATPPGPCSNSLSSLSSLLFMWGLFHGCCHTSPASSLSLTTVSPIVAEDYTSAYASQKAHKTWYHRCALHPYCYLMLLLLKKTESTAPPWACSIHIFSDKFPLSSYIMKQLTWTTRDGAKALVVYWGRRTQQGGDPGVVCCWRECTIACCTHSCGLLVVFMVWKTNAGHPPSPLCVWLHESLKLSCTDRSTKVRKDDKKWYASNDACDSWRCTTLEDLHDDS
jgi:hypothetical protein